MGNARIDVDCDVGCIPTASTGNWLAKNRSESEEHALDSPRPSKTQGRWAKVALSI